MNKIITNALQQIFPKTISNQYFGNKLAVIVFYAITFITVARSFAHILIQDGGAQSIAGIPLENYSLDASKTIVLMFSLWGLSQLIMGILYLIVLVRYKSLIPLMYIFVFTEYLFRFVIGQLHPIITNHTAPGAIGNYVMIPLALVMFVLSIRLTKKYSLSRFLYKLKSALLYFLIKSK